MQITINEFNKKFGNRAETKDLGKFFTTDGNVFIPQSFWNFKEFNTYKEALKYNQSIKNPKGIIYEIIEEVTK